ncbi:aminodeoxychorismate lyase [Corynebacterium alimapuense]|uniref:Aminodeoxychorismate lyase n=1 Tax=Corynebacterium alimapuense TaxID=1576874 RepID=A0A3M8KBR7_9CORY|nr:aminodeoxychorismate lyase [Corynebacterium alimapuense]RNE49828.1 aminodeoxychorismate lyase [Corynebacterium alimapuense]
MELRAPIIYVVEPYGGSVRRHNPTLPLVYWDDAAVTRGDGIFETLLVRDGKVINLQRHLDRFRSSAHLLELPDPGNAQWAQATKEAVAEWSEHSESDATCVWTYTRGRESTGIPSAWLTLRGVNQKVLEQRRDGVKVMTAPRGYSITTTLPGVGKAEAKPAPWLTVGAKTLNYAANMAALRYARSKGLDDVIYLDPDSERILEGATSTVITVRKGKKLRTPYAAGDILPGTTQAAVFRYAETKGWRCKAKDMPVERLLDAESVWLVSSVRVATRVTAVDGVELPAPDNEDEIRKLINRALAAES